jgi:hypothetical protein
VTGSVRKRGKTWTAYWFVLGADGRRIQRSKGGFRTKREAQACPTTVLGAIHDGSYSEPRRITMSVFLREYWMPAKRSEGRRPSTLASYEMICEHQLIPRIGHILLPHLTPGDIQGCLDELRASGARGCRPLSARSVQYAATVVKMALRYAVSPARLIPRSPADDIKRPAAPGREMSY